MWLISCNVLPANHRVTADTAQVFDLAQTLRDGVLLCQLLNNLRPHTINLKEINLRPQMSQVDLPSLGAAFNATRGCNCKTAVGEFRGYPNVCRETLMAFKSTP